MYKILLLDDDSNILNSLYRTIREIDNVDIELFTKTTEAISRANNVEFDLFISDFRMPGIDGISFLVEMKNLYPDSIRIILSGVADESVLVDSINEAEIFRFLPKPWDSDELKFTVKKSLEKRDSLREKSITSVPFIISKSI